MSTLPLSDSALKLSERSSQWQTNFVLLPEPPSFLNGQAASFSVALAYLSSEELKIPFASRRGGALITLEGVDPKRLYVHPNALFRQFGGMLLESAFGDGATCSLSRGPAQSDARELEFANSLCNDMKKVVSEARYQFQQAELLANAKRIAGDELQKMQGLLGHAPGYGAQAQVTAARESLNFAVRGSNANEIQEKTQAIAAINRDLDEYIKAQQLAAEKTRQQDNQVRLFVAAQQRGDAAVKTATATINSASKWSGEKLVTLARRQASGTLEALSTKLQSVDPNDEREISSLTDRLVSQQTRLRSAIHESQALQSRIGQGIYKGCFTWATRQGLVPATRMFKSDQDNLDAGQYRGEQTCRCFSTKIVDVDEITDDFKLAIGRQLASGDRIRNPQMQAVAGSAFASCAQGYIDQITGR